jgi:hypothetical protein
MEAAQNHRVTASCEVPRNEGLLLVMLECEKMSNANETAVNLDVCQVSFERRVWQA